MIDFERYLYLCHGFVTAVYEQLCTTIMPAVKVFTSKLLLLPSYVSYVSS
jgi:hypothetical protein